MTRSPLANPSATKTVLDRHGIRLKKSLGQNFLINDAVIEKICELSDVHPDDVVLEIGPGIGTLTLALLDSANAVISIERDRSLPEVLSDTLSPFWESFALIEKDALVVKETDISTACDEICRKSEMMGHEEGFVHLPNKLVANLPYSVAATVVLDYFEKFPFIESMTVMVQREVADRMMASPSTKNYGAYTVKLSIWAKYAGSFSVGHGNFLPPPHVESTVIRLDRRRDLELDDELIKASCLMADAAFSSRRKTIANSCKQFFSGRDKEAASRVNEILKLAKIDAGCRGETLAPDDFIRAGEAYLSAMNPETSEFS